MNAPTFTPNAPMAAPMQRQSGNAYTVKPSSQEDVEPKQISAEQIQAMLDENSNLIVEIITLNNQIKQAKGTAQQGDATEKLDKKRKKLNKNLMTLAKWADESTDQPPRPSPNPYYATPQAQYAARSMAMNSMAMAPQMAMGHPQMQLPPRYNQAAQAQMQAMAQAQYQARMSSMGGQAAYAGISAAQPRYHDPTMAYGGGMGQVMRPMPMGMPSGYAAGNSMGYSMATPHGYGVMGTPQAMPRMSTASDSSGAGSVAPSNSDVGRKSN